MRIGTGYDSHAFVDGDSVPIGGVDIPFTKGVSAHSDGDVLLHALGDALLGAAALGDLGQHFSDSDPIYKSIASSDLIEQIVAMLDEKGLSVANMDATVIAEAPRLAKHIVEMRKNIAALLNTSINNVSVKATTNEGLGWLGKQEGLAAQVVVLLVDNPSASA